MPRRPIYILGFALIASLALWGVALREAGTPPSASKGQVGVSRPPAADLSRLLGGGTTAKAEQAAAESDVATRFRLLGVIASADPTPPDLGIALISIDGQPARPYHVGAALGEGHVLQAVSLRGASIGPGGGPAAMRLDLQPLPSAVATADVRPAAAAITLQGRNVTKDFAPNVLLNNPADMAPADASGSSGPTRP